MVCASFFLSSLCLIFYVCILFYFLKLQNIIHVKNVQDAHNSRPFVVCASWYACIFLKLVKWCYVTLGAICGDYLPNNCIFFVHRNLWIKTRSHVLNRIILSHVLNKILEMWKRVKRKSERSILFSHFFRGFIFSYFVMVKN